MMRRMLRTILLTLALASIVWATHEGHTGHVPAAPSLVASNITGGSGCGIGIHVKAGNCGMTIRANRFFPGCTTDIVDENPTCCNTYSNNRRTTGLLIGTACTDATGACLDDAGPVTSQGPAGCIQ